MKVRGIIECKPLGVSMREYKDKKDKKTPMRAYQLKAMQGDETFNLSIGDNATLANIAKQLPVCEDVLLEIEFTQFKDYATNRITPYMKLIGIYDDGEEDEACETT